MKPLPEQIHVVTFAGSPENGFQAQRFQPMKHPAYIEAIAQYRLPRPHCWAVLHATPGDLSNPVSSVSKSLYKYERADGIGAKAYLKAAVDNLLKPPGTVDIMRTIYTVDMMQYPEGYTVQVTAAEHNLYSALESLDLLYIMTVTRLAGKPFIDVKHTERGALAYRALVSVYGE